MYDVIIAGASFAGLAAATQLGGHRVLLIDRKPVGTKHTSACGTILKALRYWQATDAVLQTHRNLALHTARREIRFASTYRWCTFDYRRLCEALFERCEADFFQAAVQRIDDDTVYTNRGAFRARCAVDASGWRAALASSIVPGFARANSMNFGIETIRPLPDDTTMDSSTLHFLYDPAILERGVGWLFPRGETASVGVGSYRGETRLRRSLVRLTDRLAVKPQRLHGGYFPNSLRAPTVGNVFIVGDAAGMCLGLTSEGIRPALFFGEACGRVVARVLAGELTLEDGLAEYTAFVGARRIFFRIMSTAQVLLTRLPGPWIDPIAIAVSHVRVLPWVLDQYWGLTRAWDTTTSESP